MVFVEKALFNNILYEWQAVMIIQFDSKLDQKVKHMNKDPDINISDQCRMVRPGIMCLVHMI